MEKYYIFRRMHKTEEIQNYLKKQFQKIDLKYLISKIAKKERFEARFLENLSIEKKFILQVTHYLILRENMLHFQDAKEPTLLMKQHYIQKQLRAQNFGNIENIHHESKTFLQKIVLIALVVSRISIQLELKLLLPKDPKQVFVILIFLSSGKLVSIKSYELAKDKMKKKLQQFDHQSSHSTLASIKSINKLAKQFQSEQLRNFIEDLRNVLYVQKGRIQKSRNKSKRYRGQRTFLSKSSYAIKKQNTVSFHEDINSRYRKSNDAPLLGNISRVKSRLSLDKNIPNNQLSLLSKKPLKNRTQIVKFRNLSKENIQTKSQALIRKISVITPKMPKISIFIPPEP